MIAVQDAPRVKVPWDVETREPLHLTEILSLEILAGVILGRYPELLGAVRVHVSRRVSIPA